MAILCLQLPYLHGGNHSKWYHNHHEGGMVMIPMQSFWWVTMKFCLQQICGQHCGLREQEKTKDNDVGLGVTWQLLWKLGLGATSSIVAIIGVGKDKISVNCWFQCQRWSHRKNCFCRYLRRHGGMLWWVDATATPFEINEEMLLWEEMQQEHLAYCSKEVLVEVPILVLFNVVSQDSHSKRPWDLPRAKLMGLAFMAELEILTEIEIGWALQRKAINSVTSWGTLLE